MSLEAHHSAHDATYRAVTTDPVPTGPTAPSGAQAPLTVEACSKREAAAAVIAFHYLHRKPSISHAYALRSGHRLLGVVTFGTPASRHLQIGVCPTQPDCVTELNRLWVDDFLPRNTESWFVSRALGLLPPAIVVSYADTAYGHLGYVYRALSFRYAGWTDMERKTPRLDYIPLDKTKHTRSASRTGYGAKVRRTPKVKYWTTTGTPAHRRRLVALCRWPSLDWRDCPPPMPSEPLAHSACAVPVQLGLFGGAA